MRHNHETGLMNKNEVLCCCNLCWNLRPCHWLIIHHFCRWLCPYLLCMIKEPLMFSYFESTCCRCLNVCSSQRGLRDQAGPPAKVLLLGMGWFTKMLHNHPVVGGLGSQKPTPKLHMLMMNYKTRYQTNDVSKLSYTFSIATGAASYRHGVNASTLMRPMPEINPCHSGSPLPW